MFFRHGSHNLQIRSKQPIDQSKSKSNSKSLKIANNQKNKGRIEDYRDANLQIDGEIELIRGNSKRERWKIEGKLKRERGFDWGLTKKRRESENNGDLKESGEKIKT